ncbi:hypothetical protein ACN22W_08530 [Burkholderia theae]|uniref:hypothetical protein n=1 Tax=Burkholderia theae TaxID=3143496 RepID=UPI003AFB3674
MIVRETLPGAALRNCDTDEYMLFSCAAVGASPGALSARATSDIAKASASAVAGSSASIRFFIASVPCDEWEVSDSHRDRNLVGEFLLVRQRGKDWRPSILPDLLDLRDRPRLQRPNAVRISAQFLNTLLETPRNSLSPPVQHASPSLRDSNADERNDRCCLCTKQFEHSTEIFPMTYAK